MLPPSTLTTARVLDVFAEELAARGGRITDTFHDDKRLFTRSILPDVEEVRPGDRSPFGLANAVTAVARDTRDPDLRWNLEEFGGAVVATVPRHPADGGHAAKARSRRAVTVG
jgi:hypothetical protein